MISSTWSLAKLQMLLYESFDENDATLNIICNHRTSCQLSSHIGFVYAENEEVTSSYLGGWLGLLNSSRLLDDHTLCKIWNLPAWTPFCFLRPRCDVTGISNTCWGHQISYTILCSLAAYCVAFMLGRGLKRKLSDYEENMAGLSSAFDSSRNLPYPLKRQLVLNMCLTKLQTYKMLVEPNLHRSVLIANTVRQIQEEMRQESNQQPINVCPGITPSSHSYTGMESSGISLQLPSGISQQESNCCDLRSVEDPIENSLLIVSDDDMSSAISSILKDLDFVEDISPPTCLVPTGDDQPKFPENPSLKLEDDRQDLKGAECVFGSFEISNSTSYLKDLAIDDIFEDIDTSMYDSDFCCPPLMPPRPPSLAAEEPLKTFPSCNSSSASNIQMCRTDLSELDHIMEILVGS
ncbi:SERTA domain-containing protein 2-like [Egretta garzetta]|uniref:SERTA domain-containing protein 2-like n=1 Tax=Egretta garzetta TaxID=188379 RepID=UPI00163C65A6|nr:SERTA domain-containing protein 2-like [Egretta garzetta]